MRLAELKPISYKTKEESTNIKQVLKDTKSIFQSFIDDRSSYPLSMLDKKRIVRIMRQINHHLDDILDPKKEKSYILNGKYFSAPKNKEKLRHFGLTGSELNLKLELLQYRRDALILADRIIFHIFLSTSENITRGLFAPELLETELNEQRPHAPQWNEQIKEQKKGRWERFVDWLGISKTILKSIFGFFGAGEALGELLDFLEAVAKKSVK